MSTIKENYNIVLNDIYNYCNEIKRNPKEIILLGASKTVNPKGINDAIDAGLCYIGENRVQELVEKYDNINKQAHIHFIGKLQTNKVKYIIDKVELIHSVDSLKLLNEINKQAKKINKKINILIQINIGQEAGKSGIIKEEIYDFIENAANYSMISVKGLMAVPPIYKNKDDEKYYIWMKEIFENLKKKQYNNVEMKFLSIGMSKDYKIALKHGANIIRIGSAIFGNRIYT